VGDGWEKDGDYNTGYSQTVLPLPSHDNPAYGPAEAGPHTAPGSADALVLEDDPVYRRHPDDWVNYHTRYIAPRVFVRGLRSEAQGPRPKARGLSKP
jgi:hypothetical protein